MALTCKIALSKFNWVSSGNCHVVGFAWFNSAYFDGQGFDVRAVVPDLRLPFFDHFLGDERRNAAAHRLKRYPGAVGDVLPAAMGIRSDELKHAFLL